MENKTNCITIAQKYNQGLICILMSFKTCMYHTVIIYLIVPTELSINTLRSRPRKGNYKFKLHGYLYALFVWFSLTSLFSVAICLHLYAMLLLNYELSTVLDKK